MPMLTKRRKDKESQRRTRRREFQLLKLDHLKWSIDQRQLQLIPLKRMNLKLKRLNKSLQLLNRKSLLQLMKKL